MTLEPPRAKMTHMAYSKNPSLPKVRQEAVRLVCKGWTVRKVARHFGYTHSAVVKWCKKDPTGRYQIETKSSRPKRSPNALKEEVVSAIIAKRIGKRRCGQVITGSCCRTALACHYPRYNARSQGSVCSRSAVLGNDRMTTPSDPSQPAPGLYWRRIRCISCYRTGRGCTSTRSLTCTRAGRTQRLQKRYQPQQAVLSLHGPKPRQHSISAWCRPTTAGSSKRCSDSASTSSDSPTATRGCARAMTKHMSSGSTEQFRRRVWTERRSPPGTSAKL